MAKSLREQMVELGLVSEQRAHEAEQRARQRVNRECFKHALSAARRVEVDHREEVVEYRRHREMVG